MIKVKKLSKEKDIVLFKNNLLKDPFTDYCPNTLNKYYNRYQLSKSYIFCVKINNNIGFLCRAYYLTKNYKLKNGINIKYNYELNDVYLMEKYRGKKINGEKISHISLKSILEYLNGNIMLWTTKDNIPAIKLYEKLGFKLIKYKPSIIIKDCIKNYEWLKKKKIIMMEYIKN